MFLFVLGARVLCFLTATLQRVEGKLWGLLSVVLWVSAMKSTDAARCGGTAHNSNFQGTQALLRIPGLACTKKEGKMKNKNKTLKS